MKKLLYVLGFISLIAIVSCSKGTSNSVKEDEKNNDPKDDNKTTVIRSEDIQHKVIVEFYTSTMCGVSLRAIEYIEKYSKNDNFIPISLYQNDNLEVDAGKNLYKDFSIDGLPTIIFNRCEGKEWMCEDPSKDTSDEVSLGISLKTKVEGSTANVDVELAFAESYERPLKLVVLLLENKVIGRQQNDYSNNVFYKDSKYYDMPNDIKNYSHMHVLRKNLTNILGETISSDLTKKGRLVRKNFKVSVEDYKVENCELVAFVIYGDDLKNGAVNAQRVKLGETISY
ncbi:Omp28-related outer membrane protein [Marinilabiliaceae bacterium JC040]|nr:Omp28-related outer membrane protein [Marinilabiliaceae bacterium JC040]